MKHDALHDDGLVSEEGRAINTIQLNAIQY
jgi:hypothetical protein